jgi:hypothetical protein
MSKGHAKKIVLSVAAAMESRNIPKRSNGTNFDTDSKTGIMIIALL